MSSQDREQHGDNLLQSSSPASTQASADRSTLPMTPRLQQIQAKTLTAQASLETLLAKRAVLVSASSLPSGLAMPESWSEEEKTHSALETARAVIKEHISLLHRYNEIKDIGQGLLGMIAEKRGVVLKEVGEDFSVGVTD